MTLGKAKPVMRAFDSLEQRLSSFFKVAILQMEQGMLRSREWVRHYLTCLNNRAVDLWHGSAIDDRLEQEASASNT
jgi:hypothetical protein